MAVKIAAFYFAQQRNVPNERGLLFFLFFSCDVLTPSLRFEVLVSRTQNSGVDSPIAHAVFLFSESQCLLAVEP